MSEPSLEVVQGPKFKELTPSYFGSEIPKVLDSYQNQINLIKSQKNPKWANAIQPLEESAEQLSKIWNQLDHLNAVLNSPEIRKIYEESLQKVTNFSVSMMQDQDLYQVYLKVQNDPEYQTYDYAQQRLITNALRDFKLAGVDLPQQQRDQIKQLEEQISELENQFSNNVLDATEGWTYHVAADQQDKLRGVPQNAKAIAAEKAKKLNQEGWVFNLEYPSYFAIIAYASDRELRKEFYTAYCTRASDQGPNAGKWDNGKLIDQILQLRSDLAKLTGYNNYVEYSLVPKMASNIAAILSLIDKLAVKAKPKAKQELLELQNFALESDNISELQPWDTTYYSELYKLQHYQISDEELRAYFPEPKVLDGLFKLTNDIFKISIIEIFDFESWDPTVRMFKAVDSANNIRGYFYTDLYARDGKRGGAWMSDCISRVKFANNKVQTPIAYLNCNFAPPVKDNPGLLTFDDVITLFHEFGHTIHHILTRIDYYSLSGLNGVAWDAVELPSQFMENWCWEWSVMQNISEHIIDKQSLPRDIFEKLLETRHYQAALMLLRQIEFTLFDLRIHNTPIDNQNSVQNILDQVRAEVCLLPIPKFNRFQNSFNHIFSGGYSAGYYSYLWAEVLSCDAFALFGADAITNSTMGVAFLEKILEKGGSKPAEVLFKDFAGREPEVDALLRNHAIA